MYKWLLNKILNEVSRERHNHEAQPSQGIERRRDDRNPTPPPTPPIKKKKKNKTKKKKKKKNITK